MGPGRWAILAALVGLLGCAAPEPLTRDPGGGPGDVGATDPGPDPTPDAPGDPGLPRDARAETDDGNGPDLAGPPDSPAETAPDPLGEAHPDPDATVDPLGDSHPVPDAAVDPLGDAAAPPAPLTRTDIQDAVQACDPTDLEALMARYDGPVCDRSGCTLITRGEPGSLSLRGEFNGWAETAMTAVPCRPGWFFAEVGPVPEGSDAWQYRLYRDGQWMDDRDNRWIRFADLAVNQAMYRPGVPRLARLAAVHSPQLGNDRDVYVFVPAEAFEDPQRRFPLMLLQDGWNVFDNPRAPYGSWNVDRTARTLAAQGAIEPVILAGITTADRVNEYLYTDFWMTGTGQPTQVTPRLPAYADFLVQTLLPRLRAEFPVRTGPADTAIGGSSLGGISAFWIAWMHADVFGKVAALSPSFWVGEEGSGTESYPSMREVMDREPPDAARRALKIYLDSGDGGYSPGGGEDPPYAWDGRAYTDWTRNRLIRLGWPNRPEWDTDGDPATPPADLPLTTDPATVPALEWAPTPPQRYGDWNAFLRPDLSLLCLLGRGHLHNESFWEQRFPAVLRFLFPPGQGS